MFINAKMWIPDPEDESDLAVEGVNITAEINDSDQIFIDFELSQQKLQLELGGHAALLMAISLIEMCAQTLDMKRDDISTAMDSLTNALAGDDKEDEA